MPTFCRHNRFVDRCPICKDTIPGANAGRRSSARTRSKGTAERRTARAEHRVGRGQPGGVRIYADGSVRGRDDGYRCQLVPGLRSTADGERLASEIAFASGRLLELASEPPGGYADVAAMAERGELESASWLCFVIAYLSPSTGPEPFAGIAAIPSYARLLEGDGDPQISDADVEAAPRGPRSSHEPGRGASTLRAYLAWAQRAGSQRDALTGDRSWSSERRFDRIFERLALPGLTRAARYEFLLTLGVLGAYEMSADSLRLAAAPSSDPVLASAKRVFGIGDAMNLERRANALADACNAPVSALDLALFNWGAPQRATLGVEPRAIDEDVQAAAAAALALL